MKAKNKPFAGLAITLPKVWQEIDRKIDVEQQKGDPDQIVVDISNHLCNLTEGVYKLGVLLFEGKKMTKLYNRVKNHESYFNVKQAKYYIRRSIKSLFNNILVIGKYATRLLETMYVYASMFEKEEPDIRAMNLAERVYQQV